MARPIPLTIVGNVELDTAQKRVGTASGRFFIDSAGVGGRIDYNPLGADLTLSYPDVDSALSTDSDFSYEFRIRFASIPNSTTTVASFGSTGSGGAFVDFQVSGGNITTLRIDLSGSGNDLTYSPPSYFQLNTWYDILVSRSGEDYKLHVDGVVRDTKTFTTAYVLTNDDCKIGAVGGAIFDGWIDEFRISSEARESGNYTPSTVRYDNDDTTELLIHFDGADGSQEIEDFFPETLNGSANLSLTNGFNLNANLPPMVRPDGVTWDEIDTWDTWYKNNDNWNAQLEYNLSTNLTASALIKQFGEAELSINLNSETTAANFQLAEATLNLATLQFVDGRDLDRANAQLSITAGTNVEAEMFRGGEATLNLATLTVVDGRDLDIASAELPITVDANIIAGIERNAQIQTPIELNQTASGGRILDGGFVTTNPETWDTVPGDTWEGFANDYWGENYGLLPMELSAEAGFVQKASAELNVATVTIFAGESVAPIGASAELSITMAEQTLGGVRSPASAELPITLTQEVDVLNVKGGSANIDINLTAEQAAMLFVGGSNTSNIELGVEAEADDFDNAASLLLSEIGLTASPGIILESAEANLNLATINLNEARRFLGDSATLDITLNATISPTLIPAISPFELPIQTDLNADAVLTLDGRTTLNLATINLADANRFRGGNANLTINLDIDASSSITIDNGAELNLATVTLIDGESRAPVRASATLNIGALTLFDGDLKLLDSDFTFRIYAETRLLTPKSETRIYKPYSETRVIEVDS
jgi:hypothetical protein